MSEESQSYGAAASEHLGMYLFLRHLLNDSLQYTMELADIHNKKYAIVDGNYCGMLLLCSVSEKQSKGCSRGLNVCHVACLRFGMHHLGFSSLSLQLTWSSNWQQLWNQIKGPVELQGRFQEIWNIFVALLWDNRTEGLLRLCAVIQFVTRSFLGTLYFYLLFFTCLSKTEICHLMWFECQNCFLFDHFCPVRLAPNFLVTTS